MAYNKFVKTQQQSKHTPPRVKCKTPQGTEYTIDPFMDQSKMKPWELTAAIKFFMDRLEMPRGHQKPNRFVHVHRA